MDNNYQLTKEFIKRPDTGEISEISALLEENSLTFDDDIEETLLIKIDSIPAATGSISGNVLKCIAVKNEFKNRNLTGHLLTDLVNREYQKGNTDLFLFTKPDNRTIFSQLGFFPVYEIKDNVILMENNPSGLDTYIEKLKKESEKYSGIKGKRSSIVVNCNPVTNGHLYLIEKAASESDLLHLFVVSEDRSVFPFETRYRLVREATEHIKNLVLHTGSNYIISNSTFPSYFIKDSKKIVTLHAQLDLGIFSERIAPALGITERVAGDEPLCPVTSNYNRMMNEILPPRGINFRIIKRLESEGDVVSASRVRRLLIERDFKSIRRIVPSATYNFLTSEEGEKIIDILKKGKK